MGKQFFPSLAVAVATILPAIAMAADSSAPGGTRGLLPQGSWAVALSDAQMAELRGGYRNLAFRFTFQASTAGNQADDVEVTNNNVEFTTAIAGPGVQDFTGILQHVNVQGDFNVVNNQLFVQVLIVNSNQITPADFAGILDSVTP